MSTEVPVFSYREFLKTEIGEGEFGTVYAVEHPQFPKAALRVLSRRFMLRGNQCDELRREASKLFSVTSEHVIRLLGVVMDDALALVYEYAEYGSLDKLLIRHDKMDWPLKTRIAYEIAVGMSFLHTSNILHLRLKCRNILICGNIRAKISDLCFHRTREMHTWTSFADEFSRNSRRNYRSTVAHIPPECARNINSNPQYSWDTYAYAIILWQIMSNKEPYQGESDVFRFVLEGLRPDVSIIPKDRPPELFSIMQAGWENDPSLRPNFPYIVEKIKPVVTSCEDEARASALKCQSHIDPFCFGGNKHVPPEGDSSHRRGNHRASPRSGGLQHDGRQVISSTNDEIIDRNPVPAHTTSLSSPTSDGRRARSIPTQVITEVAAEKNETKPIEFPTENSSRIIQVDDLYKVAEHLGQNWRRFGRDSLGFHDEELDNIQHTYDRSGLPEIAYQMLRRWSTSKTPSSPTVGRIVRLLNDSDFRYISSYLKP